MYFHKNTDIMAENKNKKKKNSLNITRYLLY